MLMLNQGKLRTATDLVNLIMVLKRPLLDLSIGSIARKHCQTGSNWREVRYFYQWELNCKKWVVYITQNENSRPVLILNMNYFMICFLPFMIWAKKAMEIVTYQETKMILFCHHTESQQGWSIASVEMWGVCLLDLSHYLRIVWRGSGEMTCFTYFGSVF